MTRSSRCVRASIFPPNLKVPCWWTGAGWRRLDLETLVTLWRGVTTIGNGGRRSVGTICSRGDAPRGYSKNGFTSHENKYRFSHNRSHINVPFHLFLFFPIIFCWWNGGSLCIAADNLVFFDTRLSAATVWKIIIFIGRQGYVLGSLRLSAKSVEGWK